MNANDFNIQPGRMSFRNPSKGKIFKSAESILIALIFGIGIGYLLGLLHASCW